MVSVTDHLFSLVYARLDILVFYWFYERVVFVLTWFLTVISERTFVLGAPKTVSSCLVVPSVIGC